MCSGSVVVTAYDFEFDRPGSNTEWGLIYYEAPITAQGLPKPSSLRGSTLGTRAAEHKVCNWGTSWLMVAALRCVRPQFQWHQLTYATEIKSIQLHDSIVRLSQKIVSFTFTFTRETCGPRAVQAWLNKHVYKKYAKLLILSTLCEKTCK